MIFNRSQGDLGWGCICLGLLVSRKECIKCIAIYYFRTKPRELPLRSTRFPFVSRLDSFYNQINRLYRQLKCT